MRVISGERKGLALKAVPGMNTRPTTDKVKEAIFNMIGPYFDGGTGLDLFAGSGGLGIEALSRGMARVIFVDRDAKAIQTVKANVKAARYEDKTEIYRNEAERALKAVLKRDIQFDAIFLDPPYKKQKLEAIVAFIAEHQLLAEGGFVLCEHASDVVLPDEIASCQCVRRETYGMIGVSIFHKQEELENGQYSSVPGEL